jgi:hypothetical protein
MKRRVNLSVEQLEARNTPSPVSAAGAFLSPGVVRGSYSPDGDLPAARVGVSSVAFVSPGVSHGGWSPDGVPPQSR